MGFGNVFGGAATGIATGLELGQRNRALDLESRALDIKEKEDGIEGLRQLKLSVDENIGAGLKAIEQVIEGGHASNAPPEKIAETVDAIWAGIESNAASIGRDMSGIKAGIKARIEMPPLPSAAKIGNTLESIKAEIAAHPKGIDGLSPGKRRLYEDAIRMDAFDRAMLKASEGGGSPEAAVPPEPVPTATPPVPQSLSGKNPMWSPSRQRWYLPDGTSYNQQGVPVS